MLSPQRQLSKHIYAALTAYIDDPCDVGREVLDILHESGVRHLANFLAEYLTTESVTVEQTPEPDYRALYNKSCFVLDTVLNDKPCEVFTGEYECEASGTDGCTGVDCWRYFLRGETLSTYSEPRPIRA